jgi:tRNA-dihydrouridine synthase 3
MDEVSETAATMDGREIAVSPPEVVVETAVSPAEVVVEQAERVVKGIAEMSAEELVAKAIAPVKKEFLRPPPIRPANNVQSESSPTPAPASAPLLKEKKSKRQAKRDRRQEQKSALHLCPEVAKSGNVSSCRYGENCRFSHDLEAFKSQRPADLEGNCPFLTEPGPCPYGVSCRYFGTHKENVSDDGTLNVGKKVSEVNGLKKDVQKLLWKNKMKFPKADAQLKLLGVMGPGYSKKKEEKDKEEIDKPPTNGSHPTVENCCEKVADELPPMKKLKSSDDEKVSSSKVINADNSVERECKTTTEDHIDSSTEPINGGSSVETECKTTTEDCIESDKTLKLHPREKKLIDFSDKLYLAPLTTVGNLPFRRVCKVLGADVTCGEMAMCTNLLQGQASEWALLRRHSSEDLFGVQICGAYPDTVSRTVELIEEECRVDFIDINMGCPIDVVVSKGAGSALLTKPMRIKNLILSTSRTVDIPITVKVRTGYLEGRNRIEPLITDISNWGASGVTIHGRSRQQRYSKLADWDYIYQCANKAPNDLQVFGNGDVFTYLDWNKHKSECPKLSTCMIARGALVKPWLFTEIKEQRHWDISSGERLDILKDYVQFGLQHWGSDSKGVETTRHFLLEWLSYTYRYVPVGLLEVIPARLNWRPPSYFGRDDLETLMASDSAADWIRISEMLLGKVPQGFTFLPKHKSNAYDTAENG